MAETKRVPKLAKSIRAPTVLFAVTEDWYFWSHRQRLAVFLQSKAWKVLLATRFNRHAGRCAEMGFQCIAIPFERSLRHPLRDLSAAIELLHVVRTTRPDLVHLVSHKPILLSFLAILLNPQTQFVAAFTGMGYLFSSTDRRAWWFQRSVVAVLRLILRRSNVSVLVQNEEDLRLLESERIGRAGAAVMIQGVGVDTRHFSFSEIDFTVDPIVVLPARLIRDKGIEEFADAARVVRRTHPNCRFVLVGADDPDNPAAIARAVLEQWLADGSVEWWGQRDDMPAVYAQARIICLPSYREGLPKVLVEAAACGRPLIASNVAGCREVCRDGVNGTLIEPRDASQLATAITALLAAPDVQRRYGCAGRHLVEEHFSVEHIGAQTLQYYHALLDAKRS
ncbi:MAG: glycosyltransferase family 4 protein [Proteobacteria bacterium]|nr:glycosyltransferase family 4 protein [Pseudomonadota bacterium]